MDNNESNGNSHIRKTVINESVKQDMHNFKMYISPLSAVCNETTSYQAKIHSSNKPTFQHNATYMPIVIPPVENNDETISCPYITIQVPIFNHNKERNQNCSIPSQLSFAENVPEELDCEDEFIYGKECVQDESVIESNKLHEIFRTKLSGYRSHFRSKSPNLNPHSSPKNNTFQGKRCSLSSHSVSPTRSFNRKSVSIPPASSSYTLKCSLLKSENRHEHKRRSSCSPSSSPKKCRFPKHSRIHLKTYPTSNASKPSKYEGQLCSDSLISQRKNCYNKVPRQRMVYNYSNSNTITPTSSIIKQDIYVHDVRQKGLESVNILKRQGVMTKSLCKNLEPNKSIQQQYSESEYFSSRTQSIDRIDLEVFNENNQVVTRHRPSSDLAHPFHIRPEITRWYKDIMEHGNGLPVQVFHELCVQCKWNYPTYILTSAAGRGFNYTVRLKNHKFATQKYFSNKKNAKTAIVQEILQWLGIIDSGLKFC